MPKGCVTDVPKIQKSTLKSESLCIYLDLDRVITHATLLCFFYAAVFMFYLMLCAATILKSYYGKPCACTYSKYTELQKSLWSVMRSLGRCSCSQRLKQVAKITSPRGFGPRDVLRRIFFILCRAKARQNSEQDCTLFHPIDVTSWSIVRIG